MNFAMNDNPANDSPRFSQSSNRAFRNPWVLAWIGGFLLVLGVNIAFIVTAIMTNPGLVEKITTSMAKIRKKTSSSSGKRAIASAGR